MRYAIIIEQAEDNYSAYVPDLPGCITTGASLDEIERNIREAIEFHLDGLREDGLSIPIPSTVVEYCELAAASLCCGIFQAQQVGQRDAPPVGGFEV